MKTTVLSFLVFIVFVPSINGQTACAVNVDLRWMSLPDTALTAPDGQVYTDAGHLALGSLISSRVGEVYWRETAKKKYPDICLNKEHADYFVFWSQVRDMTGVRVFPRSESGCAIMKVVFGTEKFGSDKERVAKQAFKETLEFLRLQGKASYSTALGCMSPEAIEHADETLAEKQPEPAAKTGPTSSESSQVVLDISSTPPGADIELDGRFIGSTPSSVSIPLGEHTVRITKRGFTRWERKVNALAGKISVTAELEAEKSSPER